MSSSDEICANVLHTDGCVATSRRRQLADHARIPSLVGQHKAGCNVASNIATTGDKFGACTCGCKGRMSNSSFRQSWRGAAADSRVDFRAGEAAGVAPASCQQKNIIFVDGGSLCGCGSNRCWSSSGGSSSSSSGSSGSLGGRAWEELEWYLTQPIVPLLASQIPLWRVARLKLANESRQKYHFRKKKKIESRIIKLHNPQTNIPLSIYTHTWYLSQTPQTVSV